MAPDRPKRGLRRPWGGLGPLVHAPVGVEQATHAVGRSAMKASVSVAMSLARGDGRPRPCGSMRVLGPGRR